MSIANIPKNNEDEINNKGIEIEFDSKNVFAMQIIDQLIFFHFRFNYPKEDYNIKCQLKILAWE